ncbi:unannotated protein [freshwater metagenome]|uniref:histidine kinase n=1 Tax=freshwater metagenome TaxID=449393 RepID=A0A6J6NXP9_9ZZZZ
MRATLAQNAALRQLDQLKDDFVASVSHEFRTPLTAIDGYIELLDDDRERLDPEHREYVSVIRSSAARLVRLVSDLLVVAALQARPNQIRRDVVDVSSLVRDSADAITPLIRYREVTVQCEVNPNLTVLGDASQLSQLVDNLLSNAAKFTREGFVTVRAFREGDAVRIDVADTGIGIAAADLQVIFERFSRTEHAISQMIPGTGLGLFVAREIADAHGATLFVESHQGEGSTFSLLLPVAETSVGAPDPDGP